MLSLVITLLIIALIAGVLGFGGIAGAAVGIAKIVFFVALLLFVISLFGWRFAVTGPEFRPRGSPPIILILPGRSRRHAVLAWSIQARRPRR